MSADNTTRFTLTQEDMVQASNLFTVSGFKRARLWVSWLILWLAFIAFLLVIGGVERALRDWPMVLGISLLPFLVIVVFIWLFGPISARRIYRQQRSLHGEMALGWSEKGLHIESEYGAFDIPWGHFVRWAEDDHIFILFESDRLYRMVPKRVLSPDQQASLRGLMGAIGR